MGSKNRLAKYILPIMLDKRFSSQYWVEPFVGGGNLIDKVTGPRIGSDIDVNLIEALRTIRDKASELPRNNREFTEHDYRNKDHEYASFASFAYSYGGKKNGGWARDGKGKRDYVAEAFRNAQRQSPKLQSVELICCPYDKLQIPEFSIIYCDPPYSNTTGYCNNHFDSDKFWDWCKTKKQEGHTVFVSEYEAPNGFVCVWQKEMTSSLTQDTGSKTAIEKLFTI